MLAASASFAHLRYLSINHIRKLFIFALDFFLPRYSALKFALYKLYIKKSIRSGHTASVPSSSRSSTIKLFASGMNLTSISPTIPTFGFFMSTSSSSSNSLTIFWMFFLNCFLFAFLTDSMAIFFHFSWSAFAEPFTFS